VVRRLITTLMLWGCLLGMIQPTLGCGPGTDCCPQESISGCTQQSTVPTVAADGCCATGPALASSAWVVAQPRKSLDRAAGCPSLLSAPAAVPVSRSVLQAAPLALTDYRGDFSLTYLHTARLRL
jgi:hypothetical protein